MTRTTARLFAKLVGVFLKQSEAIVIIGASEAARVIAKYLKDNERRVILLDQNKDYIEKARNNEIEAFDINTNKVIERYDRLNIYPANIFVTSPEILQNAITEIQDDLVKQYDALALPSFYDPFTAEESLIWWYGDMYGYDPDYRRHLYEGVLKAGVPPSTGNDIDYDDVADQMTRDEGLYYPESISRINTEEAHTLWEQGAAKFVDVRAKLDFNAGHIPNSFNFSLLVGLSRDALLEIAELDDTMVFSCHGPHCPYSAYAAIKAHLWGFEDSRYYAGGYPDWVEQGLPTAIVEND